MLLLDPSALLYVVPVVHLLEQLTLTVDFLPVQALDQVLGLLELLKELLLLNRLSNGVRALALDRSQHRAQNELLLVCLFE